jgi:hypothetical protein
LLSTATRTVPINIIARDGACSVAGTQLPFAFDRDIGIVTDVGSPPWRHR